MEVPQLPRCIIAQILSYIPRTICELGDSNLILLCGSFAKKLHNIGYCYLHELYIRQLRLCWFNYGRDIGQQVDADCFVGHSNVCPDYPDEGDQNDLNDDRVYKALYDDKLYCHDCNPSFIDFNDLPRSLVHIHNYFICPACRNFHGGHSIHNRYHDAYLYCQKCIDNYSVCGDCGVVTHKDCCPVNREGTYFCPSCYQDLRKLGNWLA